MTNQRYEEQERLTNLLKNINSDNPFLGLVDDLDISKYDSEQLYYVSAARGHRFGFGNIDDLDPEKYNAYQMMYVSLGRGDDFSWGNIDDLDPTKYTWKEMSTISVTRRKEVARK